MASDISVCPVKGIAISTWTWSGDAVSKTKWLPCVPTSATQALFMASMEQVVAGEDGQEWNEGMGREEVM